MILEIGGLLGLISISAFYGARRAMPPIGNNSLPGHEELNGQLKPWHKKRDVHIYIYTLTVLWFVPHVLVKDRNQIFPTRDAAINRNISASQRTLQCITSRQSRRPGVHSSNADCPENSRNNISPNPGIFKILEIISHNFQERFSTHIYIVQWILIVVNYNHTTSNCIFLFPHI